MEENRIRMQIIADNITYLRKQKGVTQKELADAIGVVPGTITDYIKLRSAPSFGIIQKMADYFGVEKSDIDSTFKEGFNITNNNGIASMSGDINGDVSFKTDQSKESICRETELTDNSSTDLDIQKADFRDFSAPRNC